MVMGLKDFVSEQDMALIERAKNLFFRVLYKLRISRYRSFDIRFLSKFDIIHIQNSYLYSKGLFVKRLHKRKKL